MGFSAVVRVASRGSHGDKVALCRAAGNLGGHKGCKGEQKWFVCGPWAEWEQVGVLSSCFTDHGKWMFPHGYVHGKHPALPWGVWEEEEQEALLPERGASLQFCYQLLRGFFWPKRVFCQALGRAVNALFFCLNALQFTLKGQETV